MATGIDAWLCACAAIASKEGGRALEMDDFFDACSKAVYGCDDSGDGAGTKSLSSSLFEYWFIVLGLVEVWCEGTTC